MATKRDYQLALRTALIALALIEEPPPEERQTYFHGLVYSAFRQGVADQSLRQIRDLLGEKEVEVVRNCMNAELSKPFKVERRDVSPKYPRVRM